MAGKRKSGMLLVLPVPFKIVGDELFCELQASAGLEQWANNFGNIVLAAPVIHEKFGRKEMDFVWKNIADFNRPERFEFVPLPWAYDQNIFFRRYEEVRKKLANLISRSRFLQFAIGGLVGDWAAVAALEAISQNREYAVHIDRVESSVILAFDNGSQERRQAINAYSKAMREYHIGIIKQSKLALLQGYDCYSAFNGYSKVSSLVFNIHTHESDCISPSHLITKLENLNGNDPIDVIYTGRMEPMKAPFQWIETMEISIRSGINIRGKWIGAGSLYEDCSKLIEIKGLSKAITAPGHESDRDVLLNQVKNSHIMLFTHITQEAPRCLIEALVCGTALVGYESNYSKDLLKNGGGINISDKSPAALAKVLINLATDLDVLKKLIMEAAIVGKDFNETKVFKERSDLIKKYLS